MYNSMSFVLFSLLRFFFFFLNPFYFVILLGSSALGSYPFLLDIFSVSCFPVTGKEYEWNWECENHRNLTISRWYQIVFSYINATIKCFQEVHSVQSLSHVQLFVTPWTAARQASLSITNSQNLIKLMSIESVRSFNHFFLCHPLLLLPSIFPSIRVFSSESVLYIRWPKCWSFNFNISPFNEYSGLIPFRVDWLDLLAVNQHHSSKASILKRSAVFIVQLTSMHDYWKNHSFD